MFERYAEAEILEIQVLDARVTILGAEHPDTMKAMENLALTYCHLGKHTRAATLEIQVLNARTRILGVGHPHTIRAMKNLAVTYQCLSKYTEAEELEIQAHELQSRVSGVESVHTTATMANIQGAQENQVPAASSTVTRKDNLNSTQVVLNPSVLVLPNAIKDPKKKGIWFGNCCLNLL